MGRKTPKGRQLDDRALAEEMKIAQAAVYEDAAYYTHFDVVKEGGEAPPDITIRVRDSLSCELAGTSARALGRNFGKPDMTEQIAQPPCGQTFTSAFQRSALAIPDPLAI